MTKKPTQKEYKEYWLIGIRYRYETAKKQKLRETANFFIDEEGLKYTKVTTNSHLYTQYLAKRTTGDNFFEMTTYVYALDNEEGLSRAKLYQERNFIEKVSKEMQNMAQKLTYEQATAIAEVLEKVK